jgi:hypothetical protein
MTSTKYTPPLVSRHSGKHKVAMRVSGAPAVRTVPLREVVNRGAGSVKLTGRLVMVSSELGSGSV